MYRRKQGVERIKETNEVDKRLIWQIDAVVELVIRGKMKQKDSKDPKILRPAAKEMD